MRGHDPAFLFYPEAFLVGCMDMTDKEVGQYIRLLCKQHVKGHITENDLKKATNEVKSKFDRSEDGFYYNARLSEEIEKRRKYAESRRRNGRGQKKDSDDEEHMQSISEAHDKHMPSISEAHDEHIKNKNTNTNKNTNRDTSISTNKDTHTSTTKVSKEMERVLEYRKKVGR